jgi:hypothetical protein
MITLYQTTRSHITKNSNIHAVLQDNEDGKVTCVAHRLRKAPLIASNSVGVLSPLTPEDRK